MTEASLVAINQQTAPTSARTLYYYEAGGSKIHSIRPESAMSTAFYWRADAASADCEAVDAVNLSLDRMSYTDQSVIQADDDFVVVMCRDGWVVWRFDKEVKLCASDSP